MNAAAKQQLRKLAVVGGVVLLHVAGLWALQSGLWARVAEVVVPVQLIAAISAQAPQPKEQAVPAKAPPATPVPPAKRSVQAPAAANPSVMAAAIPLPSQPANAAAPVVAAAATTSPGVAAAGVATSATAPSAAMQTAPAGGNTSARLELPSSDADYLHNPKPEYPRLSRQRNEQGKVVVNVFIGVDGVAQKAEIKTSSGFERLDQAALATVKAWRFVPGKRAGVPEAMWFAVPINFVME